MPSIYALPDDLVCAIHQFASARDASAFAAGVAGVANNYPQAHRNVLRQFNRTISFHLLQNRLVSPRISIAFNLQETAPPFKKWDMARLPRGPRGQKRLPTDCLYHYVQIDLASHLYYPSDMKRMFRHLKSCRCCPMHMENRPKNIRGYWDEQPLAATYGECRCACRHYMRILCKASDAT